MKKLITIILTLHASLFTVHEATAQWGCSCLPEGITFTSQSQIDSFQVNYPGCKVIEGEVEIWGDEITNLNGLSVLNSVAGNLSVLNNNVLTSFSGLGSLTSIGGGIMIYGNEALTDLTGLNNLTSIGGGLIICYNYSLSTCEVQWLSDYLLSPNGSIYIYLNAAGCSSVIELAMSIGGNIPCLPYGKYVFYSQSDIDNFHLAFPDCTELEGDVQIVYTEITNLNGLNMLTTIDGDFRIYYNESLTSLTGLEGLASVTGELQIAYNTSLTSLVGLEGLTSISGGLLIYGNEVLTSLTGLNGLDTLNGDLKIGYVNKWGEYTGNPSLTSLAGLESLNSIGSDVFIGRNDNLTSLTGLDNLTSIGGGLIIDWNSALTSLTGLDNLTSIGGQLQIWINTSLASLMALENLASIGGDLWISYNDSLSTCEAQWLCEYLFNPSGSINISWNAPGCNSVIELADACGGSAPCLPYGNYYFTSQSDIDNFHSAFPECNDLEGDVTITSDSDITNLNGLNMLTSIDNRLEIRGNSALSSLTGLNGLTSIGGELHIGNNPALMNLIGLEELESFGGYIRIDYNSSLISLTGLNGLTSLAGYLIIENNDALINLSGLEGLATIGTNLNIMDNDALTDLTGLENLNRVSRIYLYGNPVLSSLTGIDQLEPDSVGGLAISYNSSLTACNNPFVCNYLIDHDAEIHDNAPGCNSPEEVEDACAVGVEESAVGSWQLAVECFPNPTSGIVDFRFSASYGQWTMDNEQWTIDYGQWTILKIYNSQGQQVAELLDGKWSGGQAVRWDASGLPAGIYYYQLSAKGVGQVGVGKIVKY